MAGSKTDALEQRFLDFIFKNNAHATPLATPGSGGVWVALFTAAPSDSAAGTEVSGSGYTRINVTAANWTHTGGTSTVTNTADVLFPVNSGSSYTVVGWAIMDASSAGNMLYWGDISPSVTVAAGDQARFAASTGITITED